MKIGLQLYSIRDCIQSGEDLAHALKKVKAMGYDGVEFAGYAGMTPEEVRRALDDAGIEAVSSHTGIDGLEASMEEVVAYAVATGAKFLVCAGSRTETKEDLLRLERVMKKVRSLAEPHGIIVGYHNHSHEFVPIDGTLPIDYIADNVCKLEPDTFWVYHAGTDPAAFLRERADQIALVHLKDGNDDGKPCAIGEGVTDIAGILQAARDAGVEWAIVENDDPVPDGLSDVQRSMEWLRKNVL